MAKIIKNTTITDIFINESGQTISANDQITVDPSLYYIWAKPEMIAEITTDVNAGNLVINNGLIDLSPSDGLRFLQYPERVTIQQNGSDVTQVGTVINFTGSATVTNNGNGTSTVNVGAANAVQCLREVTMVNYGFGPVDIESNLLFEPGPVNDIVLFLKEQ
jgi:hypothetical protein